MTRISTRYRTATAAFLYAELQTTSRISAQTLAFVCAAVDAAVPSLDTLLSDPYTFPRDVKSVSMIETVQSSAKDPQKHFMVDLFDRNNIPIGSIRIYLDGVCRLTREASDETMLMYKASIGLL